MMQFQDCKNIALSAHTSMTEGTVNDKEVAFLKQQPGVTADTLADCWKQFLATKGYPSESRADGLYTWLGSIGHN